MTNDDKNAYLQKIQAEWDEFKAKVKSKKADTEIWTKDKMDDWEKEEQNFEEKMKSWRDQGEDTGEDWKDKAADAWSSVKKKWNDVVEDITD